MKKIIILGIALITTILSSCNNPNSRSYTNNNINVELKNYNFEYNGHKYILFYNPWANITGVVHDPDCPCNKKD